MWMKLALIETRWLSVLVMTAVLALPAAGWAQAARPGADDEELSDEGDEPAGGAADEEEEEDAPEPAAPPPQQLPPAPPVAAPPMPPPSPFVFTLKGSVAGTVYTQDVPTTSGNGGGMIFGPLGYTEDKWFYGGDVRQTRLTFTVKGPEVLGGATPVGVVEFDLFGGNQITSVPGATQVVTVRGAMGEPLGSGAAANVTSSAQGDESLLPRLRLAYVELNWGAGSDILRVGQFHNLLLPMIAASGSHTGTPLGYGAGQLGWRSPGITYLHRFALSADVNMDVGLQLNRNSWIDNFPSCAPGMSPPAVPNCLPGGVSLGEASMLPQFEARVVLSGGKAPSPWPMYAPNVWQVHLVGHWDQKDLSGVGGTAKAPATAPPGTAAPADSLSTLVFEAGGKLHLGPVLIAANAWTGKNSGGLFGNLVQLQLPSMGDVSGMGAWGQLGFSFTDNVSVWFFGGIDKPNQDEAIKAGFTRLQNMQLAGMLAYVEGPIVLAFEYMNVATKSYTAPTMPTMANPMGTAGAIATTKANQIALTLTYNF